MTKKFIYPFLTIMLSGLIAVGIILAWTEPGTAPPGGNVSAPLNIGSGTQYKAGALGIGGLLRGYSDAIFGGKVGIGTDAPEGVLDVGKIIYTYKFDKTYAHRYDPRCPCDARTSAADCANPTFTTDANLGVECYDWVAGGGSRGYLKDSSSYSRQMNIKDGKIKMVSQTEDADSVDTVATKGYVDSKAGAGGCPAGYKRYDFTFTTGCFKDGANVEGGCNFDVWANTTGQAKIRSGVLYTRVMVAPAGKSPWRGTTCDTGWVTGNVAYCEFAGEAGYGPPGWVKAIVSTSGITIRGKTTGNACFGTAVWSDETFTGDNWK